MPAMTATRPATDAAGTTPVTLTGWGGGPGTPASLVTASGVDGLREALAAVGPRGAIARGMGRSYGDAAQRDGGLVLDLTRMTGWELDAERGEVTAQAGITLGALLGLLVPRGWMLPVLPGTQHVTVGGAIASDIHGKSHGVDGTFGSHVRSLELMTAAGDLVTLEPAARSCFAATLGGMGLTGVIVSARIGLAPAASGMVSVDTDRADSLDDVLALLAAPGGRYRVAWLDLLGPRPGRGVVTRAESADAAEGPAARWRGARRPRGRPFPRAGPAGALRPSTVRAFNELRFRSALVGAGSRRSSARTCFRSTRSSTGRGCTGRPDSSSTSSSCRPVPNRCSSARSSGCAPAGPVLPRRAQGLRRTPTSAAVVPDAGVDAGARSAAQRSAARVSA